ncbi:MAG TPA: hypothetical protein VFE28_16090 [Candidatus Krumholzibacteria bacterium]|nr:hypothetical protein [Candidatus Krumholzibacteria bacterium]
MPRRAVSFVVPCGLLALFLVSCATSTMLSSWIDPESPGKKMDHVLVIGVAKNEVVRRKYEDDFVKELASRHIKAMPSYQILPDPAAISQETVAPHIQAQGITHVLVTRIVDRKTVTTYVPPTTTTYGMGYPSYYPSYYGSWYGYYNAGYSTVSSPGYTYDTEYVHLETNVYDIPSQKLIWTGLTETELGGKVEAQVDEFIHVLIGAMTQDKLF